jgi:hypothetical protein
MVDVPVGAVAVEYFDFGSVPPPAGRGGASTGSGHSFPIPVLAAWANNNNDDGCIIVEDTREKTRRGQQDDLVLHIPTSPLILVT